MSGVIIITFIDLILSIILVVADSKLKSKKENSNEYLKHLPGYNCGACGYAGCKGMSEAMVEDINNYKKCKPLRGDKLKEMESFLKSIGKI